MKPTESGPPRLIHGALDMAAEIERLTVLAQQQGQEVAITREQDEAKDAEIKQLRAYQDETAKAWTKLTESQEQEIAELRAQNAGMLGALTPSADTKAAYIGEFHFNFQEIDEFGDERSVRIAVPWDTIKGIMAAIRKHAEASALLAAER